MEVIKLRFKRGKKLDSKEKSQSLAYGIIGTKKDTVLRITLQKELANMFTDDESRHQEEIYLSRV